MAISTSEVQAFVISSAPDAGKGQVSDLVSVIERAHNDMQLTEFDADVALEEIGDYFESVDYNDDLDYWADASDDLDYYDDNASRFNSDGEPW